MRRSLLTARSAATVVAVGESAAATAGTRSNVSLAWCTKNPANATGFIGSATFVTGTSNSYPFAIFTVSPAGDVTDISATFATGIMGSGVNNVALSPPLAINAGDYVGIWIGSSTFGTSLAYASETGLTGPHRAGSASSKPTVGGNISAPSSQANAYFKISAAT